MIVCGFLHVFFLGDKLPSFTLHNWIFVPAVSSLILVFYFSNEIGLGILSNSIIVWLGKISYCFYSFQFHVLEGLRWLVPWEKFGAIAYAVSSFLALLLVSAFAYHFIEEPARVWIRRRSQRSANSA